MRDLLPFDRFIILDMTHGGKILALELKKMGEVIGIDVYKTLTTEEIKNLKKEGIQIRNDLRYISLLKTDLIIAPIHCDPSFLLNAIEKKINTMTFHEIVGKLLLPKLSDKTIIEITGTRGKTTTAITLATLLSKQQNILCLSSRGLEIFQDGQSRCLMADVDIAPPYLLHVKEYLQDFKIGIFEVSLGGTGLADIGILTNIIEDYPIANLKKRASDGKKQLFEYAKKNSVIFFNKDDQKSEKLIKNTKANATIISFGETGQIKAKKPIFSDLNDYYQLEIEYNFTYKNQRMGKLDSSISCKLIGMGYFYAILIYVGVALLLETRKDEIIKNLSQFNGIKNRLNFSKLKSGWILKDINSGVGHLSINSALEALSTYMRQIKGKIWFVLDADSATCEGISVEQIKKIISQYAWMVQEIYSTDQTFGKPFQDLNDLIDKITGKIGKNDILFITKKVKG